MKFCYGASIAGAALVLAAAVPAEAKPTLVVQITADQLRADLLIRYRPVLTGGLGRLMAEGAWVQRARVAHAMTNSFPGHTTLASGRHPSHHGLTANEWWLARGDGWTWVDVGADDRYKLTGFPDRNGVSPRYLQGDVLADWVERANPAAKTVALSTGAPIAMAYAGRRPDAAYWYDGQSGGFVTSTYYEPTVRAWIGQFNTTGIKAFQAPAWTLSVPEAERGRALPDATAYENEGRNNTFPHVYEAESRPAVGDEQISYGRWYGGTPLKDQALFALAAKAVDEERLGQRGVVDYLAVLPDSTDSVGHRFGPSSLEQLDALLRLDRALGAFLDHLDRTVGRDGYVVGLGADHGVADPPEATGAKRVTTAEIEAVLDKVEAIAVAHQGSREALADKIAEELKRADFIADAYTEARLEAPGGDAFTARYRLNHRPGMTYDFPLWTRKPRLHHPARYGVVVRFKEGMIFDNATAVHGSPYDYDSEVPLIVYGPGVRPGVREAGAQSVDLAPTLAALAGISPTAPVDGRVVTDIVSASD